MAFLLRRKILLTIIVTLNLGLIIIGVFFYQKRQLKITSCAQPINIPTCQSDQSLVVEKLVATGSSLISLKTVQDKKFISFRAHRNGIKQESGFGANYKYNKIIWTQKDLGTNENFDVENSRFQPKVPGKYLLSVVVSSEGGPPPNNILAVAFFKNGALHTQNTIPQTGTEGYSIHLTQFFDMDGEHDYVEVFGMTSYSSPIDVSGDQNFTTFTGALVAEYPN